MKKVILIQKISIILFVITLLLYISTKYELNQLRKSTEVVLIPTGMSAEETVELYFKLWDDKNSTACSELWVNSKEHYYDFEYGYHVELVSCDEWSKEETEESYSNLIESGNYYDYTYIFVRFNINMIIGDIAEGCWSKGDNCFGYFLVKETKDSDWRIQSAGVR